MKLRQRGLVASILMATLVVSPLVEAKRAGNGKSQGMQRSVAPSQSRAAPPPQQRVPQQQAPIAAQQKTGSNTGKMIAAGVAGAAVGAIAANALADDKTAPHTNNEATASAEKPAAAKQESVQQEQQKPEEKKSGIPSWIWLILIGGAAFFIFRKISAKKKLENSNPYAPNNNGGGSTTNTPPFGQNNTNSNSNIYGANIGGAPTNAAPFPANNTMTLPDGTEQSAFLRIARQRFNHIQSMNTASNIEEIRRYLTTDLYNSMYQDIMANRDQDVAEFQNLNAEIADSSTENNQYVASVRFSGLVSEDLNSQAQPFTEVWHFVKPINSQQDWVVAGIQVE